MHSKDTSLDCAQEHPPNLTRHTRATYAHQQPHFSIHLNCEKNTRLHTDLISLSKYSKFKNRETSHSLATPPPADTALMPNSGSLCNGQGAQTYVEVQHPSIAVFLNCRSLRFILYTAFCSFCWVSSSSSSSRKARVRFVVALCVLFQHTSLDNNTFSFAFRSRHAAMITMQSIQMLELRSKAHASGLPSNPQVQMLGRKGFHHARHKTFVFQTTTRTLSKAEKTVHSRETLW